MAGRRLLDAAKLFNAGASITKQHLAIRKSQWDTYTRTSTLARAIKSQTDRVTVTLGAAIALAKRFSDDIPQQKSEDQHYQQQRQEDGRQAVQKATRNSLSSAQQETHNLAKDVSTAARNAGLDNLAEAVAPKSSSPTNDDDGTLDSLRRRELQRRAKAQLPTTAADTQPLSTTAASGQDTFNRRSDRVTTPELSSLPRTVLPKHSEVPPATGGNLQDKALNQDSYPSPDDVPEAVDLDAFAFHSPKVSRMLGKQGAATTNPYANRPKLPAKPLPEMAQASQRFKHEHSDNPLNSSSEAPASKSEPLNGNSDTQELAASIAEEALAPETESKPYEMRESRVPATRLGRIWQYSGLATSMAFGAVGESFRRLAGGSSSGNLMLSEGNMDRLVAKLSRMRGAALKLGQMISFQDSKVLPPAINAVLQRVQDSADYMPASQRNQVLERNLGAQWRELFSDFEEKPFAAASIGQVHKATLKSSGAKVAVKVQYPGVRNSIDSDLNNLSLLLTASQLLPKGLFLEKTIANARTELGWECDYEREAQACIRFRDELVVDERDVFRVPKVYTEASGKDVLTAEFMHGTGVTKVKDLSQSERDWIGTNILRLCLRELMEWRFMQTDPNWTNFLYNREDKKLELLDFGASREYPAKFVEPYVSLLFAAAKNDRQGCREYSIQLGYLTGSESNEMLNAHIDSILTLAEPFTESAPEVYDFEDQTITDRVRANIGVMLRERLAPPPEETYSLHRKLSGAFLLCARLKSKVPARDMFAKAVDVWNGRADSVRL